MAFLIIDILQIIKSIIEGVWNAIIIVEFDLLNLFHFVGVVAVE